MANWAGWEPTVSQEPYTNEPNTPPRDPIEWDAFSVDMASGNGESVPAMIEYWAWG